MLNDQGYFKSGWPKQVGSASVRSIAVDDLDGDGKQEIAVALGIASRESVWVYRHDGTLMPGWPQLSAAQKGSGYSYGVFGDGLATGDIDGDGLPELIVPTDTAYIGAYNVDGSLVKADLSVYGGRTWAQVALYESYATETTTDKTFNNYGWGYAITGSETRADLYRAELGHAAAICSDVDGDGVEEVIVTALMTDRTNHTNTNLNRLEDTRYMTVFLLNGDRTRYTNAEKGYDWTTPPVDLGSPLKKSDSVSIAAGVFSEPTCADLDGNGEQDILFNSYDGKLHCFSLDGKEHGSWPFTLPKSNGSVYEYATPATCVDLDGDGKKEVIIASLLDNASSTDPKVNGALYVLSSEGKLLAKQDLHNGYASYEGVVSHANGVMGAPVVADVDKDGKYEVLLNTTYYALCAYKLDVPKVAQPTNIAYASNQTILLNGKSVELAAYALKDKNGNLTNYVKVRDVAMLLNGSASQFNVTWDGTVDLRSHTPYTANGTEMQTPYSGDQSYTVPTSQTKVDGTVKALDAIVLKDSKGNGYTYYKLRDLGTNLGFTVDWNKDQGIVVTTP